LVPPENPNALAGAIKRLMDDARLRARLVTAARQRVVEKFSIEREVAAHERLYLDLMGKLADGL
jgi:glycosyltransferase involved in cell wall biosynthesis